MTDKYQNIILTLSDGREVIATTKEFMKEGDDLKIMDIKVTPPRELPEGMGFEEYDI